MGFCTWCQLETESEDTCEWCKRPVRRNPGLYDYGAVALLREDHGDSADRVTTIFGGLIGVAFVALIAFVVMNGRNAGPTTDPLSQIAESEKVWTAERLAPASTPAPRPSVPVASATPSAMPRPTARVPQTAAAPSASLAGSARSTPALLIDGEFAGSSPSTGLILEEANVAVVRTKGGQLAVKGEVRITNVTGGRLSDISMKLVTGKDEVPLDLGNQDTDLGSGSGRTFIVVALDLPERVANAADAHVLVRGTGPGGDYQGRMNLK